MLEKQLHNWRGWPWIVGILLAAGGFQVGTYIWAETLWFQEVGHVAAFYLRIGGQVGLGIMGTLSSLLFLGGNLLLAKQLPPLMASPVAKGNGGGQARGLGLRSLLLTAFGLALLISLQLFYLGRVFLSYWDLTASVYNPTPPIPLWAKPAALQALIQQLMAQPWQLVAVGGVTLALMLIPRFTTVLAAGVASLGLGGILAQQWTKVLPALDPVPFQRVDPQFGQDLSFYILRLPGWEVVQFWGISLVFFALASVTLRYLLAGDTLSQGRFQSFTPAQQRHLYGLGGLLLLGTSLSHWLGRYQTLYSQRGAVYGASYTDIHVSLPIYGLLGLFSLGLGLAMIWLTIFWQVHPYNALDWLHGIGQRRYARQPPIPYRPLSTRPLLWGLLLYGTLAIVGTGILPPLVQRLGVQPNELQRETPYLERAIAETRAAFALDTIDDQPFSPDGALTVADLDRNRLTLDNIRLWDTRPLLATNRQLQQIRLYYEFADADVDRYTLVNDDGTVTRRQVFISPRELNYERVPAEAKTWVNEHLVYTHGYGFTLSPVNIADDSGLPFYFIRDIAHIPSDDTIRRSLPLSHPRLYYGELTNTYVMTQTRVRELDYPSGSENVYTIYAGRGGIGLGNFWRRLLFAWHLKDWRMVVTADFTPQTRLLFRRQIMERVKTIAPFLRYDQDPYLVVADLGDQEPDWWGGEPLPEEAPSHLYWMLDAYTTSDRYPYSDPLGNDFNYIRNSVKVVIDAYHGTVRFYVAEASDPIIQTWSRLLPGMFQPLTAMPSALRAHIRYPQDLFQVQSQHLMTYHMTDPQVFYNREDQWREPQELYGQESQAVQPYYLIMKLPEEATDEFILLRPFTPALRNNLIAWMAARSDGDRYGRSILYRFPKEELVFGPEQIEARINQDPEISQRISLWNTQGSQAIQGNLLVIPMERSLLYVEPIYLEAEQTSLPSLARVVVAYGNRIAMAPSLDNALEAIFQGERPLAAPVLRELGLEDIPLTVPPGSAD